MKLGCRYILILIILSGLPLVSAFGYDIYDFGTFKQGQEINLIQICASCTENNITAILFPNSSIAISHAEMTNDGGIFNYTLSSDYTGTIGKYLVNGVGDISGANTEWNYEFMVTGSGEALDQSISQTYIIIIIGLLLILGVTVIGSIKIPFKNGRNEDDAVISINNLKYLKIVLWVFAYLEFLFIIFIIKNLTYGAAIFNGAYQFFNIVYFILLIGLIPMLPVIVWITIVIWLNDKKTQEDLERGIEVD